ncbi:MAG: phosphoglycerate kinase [Dehalococcoidia bacterium]|nr:phosphoglycerate kinase [Dehalococcoidia bacterium]
MFRQTFSRTRFTNRTVLLRTDFNTGGGGVEATLHRLRETLPTIHALRRAGARVVIATHVGRPGGVRDDRLSTRPLAAHLEAFLGCPVATADDCVGPSALQAIAAMVPGDVLMLENLRFHPGEESNSPEFARQLACLADVYVNDAFATIHRNHASIVGVTAHLRSVPGLLLEREMSHLLEVTEAPERPLGLLLGGSKVHDKVGMIERMLPLASVVCIGGALAPVVMQQRAGVTSLATPPGTDSPLRRLCDALAAAERSGQVKVLLPIDVVASRDIGGHQAVTTAALHRVQPGWHVGDIGYRTVDRFSEALAPMKMIVWNGPLGRLEDPQFADGTTALAHVLANLDARVLVGGGDTAAAVRRAGVDERLWHVSTGGGATLAMLGNEELPGLAALGWHFSTTPLFRSLR